LRQMMHKHEINSMLCKSEAEADAAEEEKKALVEVRALLPPCCCTASSTAALLAPPPTALQHASWATARLPSRDGGNRPEGATH